MNEFWLTIALFAAFAVVFPLFFTGIIRLVAIGGGWTRLAERFPGDESPTGERCGFASARFGFFFGYNRSLNVTVSPNGVHMWPMWLFRAGHRPILVPWSAIEGFRKKGMGIFPLLDMVIKGDGGHKPVTISFHGRRLIDVLLRHAPPQTLGQ